MLAAATLVGTPQSALAAVPAPSSLSPNGTDQADIPTLSWSRVAGATRYEVQLSTSDTFATTLAPPVSTVNRHYVPSVQVPAGRIHWRVRSLDSTGASSPWAQASFTRTTLAGPTLQSPADGADLPQPSEPPVLSWSPVPNATGYEVMIDNDEGFTDGTTTATTSTTSYVVVNPQPATTFWWRVRALRGTGLNTEWSDARSYTIGGLNEVVPKLPAEQELGEQELVEDVVFDWDPVPGARDYELRVSTDRDFNTLVGGSTIVVKATRYSPPTTFNNDEYWWQVRARDNSGTAFTPGNTIPWTDEVRVPVRQFQRYWPDKPTLEYPANGARVGDPMYFQWSPVDHASRYQVDMGSDPNFSPTTFTTCYTRATTLTPGVMQPSTQWNPNCTPQPGKVQYWRVRALDDPFQNVQNTGVNGIWSEIRSFTYDPGLVTPVAPRNGSSVEVPTLRWEAVRDAEKYHVEITNKLGSVVAKTDTYSLSWTPSVKLDPANSPYRWVVTSIDTNGHSSPSLLVGDQWTFTVTAPDPEAVVPDQPASLTPLSGNTVTARFPELKWQPDPSATHYKVYIGPAGGTVTQAGGNHAYPVFTDVSKSYLTTGAYDWLVQAWNGPTYLGQSPTSRFTITDLPPVTGQKLASNGTTMDTNACARKLSDAGVNYCDNLLQTPVLDWDPVPEASHYLVYLFKDRELTNPVYTSPPHYVTTQNTRWTPMDQLADSQAGDAYFWYVRPCKATNVCAPDPTAATHSFDKESRPIELLSPADGVKVENELELTWRDNLDVLQQDGNGQQLRDGATPTKATVEAKQYRVEISDDPTFASVLKRELVDQTTYTPYALTLPEGPLYWRVQAVDGSGNSLTWSETRSVDKESPAVELVTPVSPLAPGTVKTVGGTPFFRWQPQNFAAGYALEVYDDNDTTMSSSNRVINVTTLKQPAYAPTQQLPVSGSNYLWRVRRVDADARPGDWSPLQAFKVTGDAPELMGPAASSVVGTDPVFSWGAVPGATTYTFERRLEGSTSTFESVSTYAQSWAPTSKLADGRWEWRVSSVDASRKVIASSPWRPFLVDSVVPTVTSMLPGENPAPDSNWTVTFSEPVTGVDSTTMRLYRAGQSDPVIATVASSDGGRTWTLDPELPMDRGVDYTLRLTSGITDRAGNAVAATSYTRSCASDTTTPPPPADTTRPRVVKKSPGTRTTPGANWVVTFSERVVKVSGTTMKLYRAGSTRPVAARITKADSGRKWTLNPSKPMARRVRYTLKLTSGITDRAGNRLRATSYYSTPR